MLRAYFDESGTHFDSEFFVVAGLVSTPQRWVRFVTQWRRILQDVGVERFHMVDLAHARGEFEGWSREQRDHLMRRIIPAVRRNILCRVWTVVRMSAYRELLQDGLPYSLGALGCASRLRSLAKQLSTRIIYVFEQGGKDSRGIMQSFQELIDAGQEDFYGMDSLRVEDARLSLPLQAADLHAYELHKFFQDQVRRRGSVRKRGSLRELLEISEVGGFMLDYQKLRRFLEGMVGGEMPVKIKADFLNANRRYPGMPD